MIIAILMQCNALSFILLYYHYVYEHTLSVIRQKGVSQNGGKNKTKHAKFSVKRIFLTP